MQYLKEFDTHSKKLKMELLNVEERDIDECGTGQKENVIIRLCRKKYKCLMMFLCIVALLLQTVYLVIEKTESRHIDYIMSKLPNITRRLKTYLNIEDNSTSRETMASFAEYG